jgi:hypothetical protein
MAAEVRAQLRARASHADRGSRQEHALLAEFVNETPCNLAAAASFANVPINLAQVVARSRRMPKARHDQGLFRSASVCTFSM